MRAPPRWGFASAFPEHCDLKSREVMSKEDYEVPLCWLFIAVSDVTALIHSILEPFVPAVINVVIVVPVALTTARPAVCTDCGKIGVAVTAIVYSFKIGYTPPAKL